MAELHNDATDNLLGSLIIAGHYMIPEVCLFFNYRLFRGNRYLPPHPISSLDLTLILGLLNLTPMTSMLSHLQTFRHSGKLEYLHTLVGT